MRMFSFHVCFLTHFMIKFVHQINRKPFDSICSSFPCFFFDFKRNYAVACCVGWMLASVVVTIDMLSVIFSSFSLIASHGNRFCSSILKSIIHSLIEWHHLSVMVGSLTCILDDWLRKRMDQDMQRICMHKPES